MRTSRLHAAADVATRVVAVLTVTGLAGLADTISYQHMVLLGRRQGVLGLDAHAFPICVDGLDLIGVLVLLADRRRDPPSGHSLSVLRRLPDEPVSLRTGWADASGPNDARSGLPNSG